MTNQEAFYIVGNIPIMINDYDNYSICQYQEAKAIALDCIQKIEDIKSAFHNEKYDEDDFICAVIDIIGEDVC